MSGPRTIVVTNEADGEDRQAASGSSEKNGALFPLPLVPFERYMIVDERADYPMAFVIVVELQGVPDRSRLQAAFEDALARHPLLSARLRRRGRRSCWELVDDVRPATQWHDRNSDPGLRVERPINLRTSPGLHLDVVRARDKATLRFLFHHALCDGVGALQFIGDVLAGYGNRAAPPSDRHQIIPLEVERLKQRGQFEIPIPAPVTRWQAIRSMFRESWKVLCRRPRPLAVPRPSGRNSRTAVSMPAVVLAKSTFGRYRARATELGSSVNDLLLRDMFLAIRRWNGTVAAAANQSWIRVTVPVSLRYRRQLRMPAANALGYALLTRRAGQCDESPEFLSKLSADMTATQKWGLAAFFVHAVGIVDAVPGLLWLLCRLSRRFSTLVLTNTGDPVRRFRARIPTDNGRLCAGDVVVENIYGAPPVRPGTRIAVGVSSCNDQFTLAARYDPRWLDEELAAQFLTLYREQLEQTAAGASNAG